MTLPILWVIVSPLSILKPPNNPPTLMQQGYLTESPLQNFNTKKKKTKEAKTEVTINRNASQIYVFHCCSKFQNMEKRDGSSVKITNAKMEKISAWKTYIYLFICTYIYFTYGTDKEMIDFEIYMSIISSDSILMLFYPHIFTIYIIYIYIYISYIYIYAYIYYIYTYK